MKIFKNIVKNNVSLYLFRVGELSSRRIFYAESANQHYLPSRTVVLSKTKPNSLPNISR